MTNYSNYKVIKVEKANRVATVTLNRPEHRNAVSPDLHAELENVWVDLAADDEVYAIILTGAGSAFSTGGDVKAMAERHGTVEAKKWSLAVPAMTRRLFQNMLEVNQPIIGAINGHATGLGTTLALFCDISIVADTAKFGDTHVKVGLVAGDGGSVIWPLLIGANRAKEFLMRGRLITGAEAHAMNLVNYALPTDQVMPKAREIAEELAALPPRAVQWTKLSVNKWLKDQLNLVLDTSIAYEMLSMQSEDHAEAARAFVEQRAPNYKGY